MNKAVFTGHPLIMGIVNVTPDSFSGDGVMQTDDFIARACDQAVQMVQDGADLLDIGGESTRPDSTPLSAADEIARVVPVILKLREREGKNLILSVDTMKAEVADAALRAGANIVNDVTALGDPAMAEVIVRYKCQIILMDNRATWGAFAENDHGNSADIVSDVKRNLQRIVKQAKKAGVTDAQIILDPGIGFGKNATQNMALIKHVGAIKTLGYPVLIAPSRKSFIGQVLDVPVDERLEGTAATVAISAFLGADMIRVHDVKFMARVARMADAIRPT